MADLERLPDPPTHALHLTDTELSALRQALISGVRDENQQASVRADQAALFLATERPTHHERFAALVEDAGAPLPADGERTWCTLTGGPATGYRVYVTAADREVFVRPVGAEARHRYVRNSEDLTWFVYTPKEDV
ncbi:hypothetical protein KGD82_16410 [Nocardiopsis eucommiae]|uniref:Uncharacterized protein n=1 Tax=Nocardiopsis eucommiae TaxID=2831970 RepID=A0A975L857_9ACTN|nr:hypothetical protein KGD82_16410 [Nocardiopsis eucommiae]